MDDVTGADQSVAHQSFADPGFADLPRLARRAVELYASERAVLAPPEVSADSPLLQPAACFVSIKTDGGDLRGCIGTIEPARPSLLEEVLANAVSAATRDPRFPPVAAAELPHLRFSVDVLSAPEPTRPQELDPRTYGVIVTDEQNRRRGLLLPAIEGVETVEQQVDIAARKAGLRPDEPLRFYRFRVQRFREQPDTN
ncbi:MAG TPA: AmmeMemoRadiSam system protein A [Pyrinomonadaceae bacterium]|jgi:AmmeMemoRadiSam system protein A